MTGRRTYWLLMCVALAGVLLLAANAVQLSSRAHLLSNTLPALLLLGLSGGLWLERLYPKLSRHSRRALEEWAADHRLALERATPIGKRFRAPSGAPPPDDELCRVLVRRPDGDARRCWVRLQFTHPLADLPSVIYVRWDQP